MTTVYPNETGRCALCECGIHTTPHTGLHSVRECLAFVLPMCEPCGSLTRRGLSPEQLLRLEGKLKAEAEHFGLGVAHGECEDLSPEQVLKLEAKLKAEAAHHGLGAAQVTDAAHRKATKRLAASVEHMHKHKLHVCLETNCTDSRRTGATVALAEPAARSNTRDPKRAKLTRECRSDITPHAGLHVIRGSAVIGYAFCLPCFDLTRHSLSAELVRRLEAKLDANAVTYGLEVAADTAAKPAKGDAALTGAGKRAAATVAGAHVSRRCRLLGGA